MSDSAYTNEIVCPMLLPEQENRIKIKDRQSAVYLIMTIPLQYYVMIILCNRIIFQAAYFTFPSEYGKTVLLPLIDYVPYRKMNLIEDIYKRNKLLALLMV